MPMQLARPIASVIDFAAAKRRMRKKSHGSHRVSPVRDCVRVVIVIRSQVFLQSLRHLLNAKDDFVIVAACHDTSACLAAICEHKPDLAVFETLLPGGGAVRILAAIAAERLHVRPVLLISYERGRRERAGSRPGRMQHHSATDRTGISGQATSSSRGGAESAAAPS